MKGDSREAAGGRSHTVSHLIFCAKLEVADVIVSDHRGHVSSKYELHLHPHGAGAAVGEIPIQKAGRRRSEHTFFRNLSELRMVEDIESFPAKLQTPRFRETEGLEKGHVKIVDTTGPKCVAAYRGSVGQTPSLDPVDVSRADAHIRVRVPIPGCTGPGTGSWSHDGAAVERRARVADIGTVVD